MFSAIFERAPAPASLRDPHILLVVPDQSARYALAATLLEAGFQLTLASSTGIGNALVDGQIDLVISARPLGELSDARPVKRARASNAQVPILLIDQDTAYGPGVLELALQAIQRWPVHNARAA